jgi:hypothetical protein
MRRFLLAAGGLAIVSVAIGIFLFRTLDSAIETIIETVGSTATGTAVTLKSANISLRSGTGRLSGLVIGNPKGYSTPSAFEFGDVQITLDTSTLGKRPIVIREIVIDSLGTTYEVGPHGSNIGVIRSNVAQFASNLADALPGAYPHEGRTFMIDDLYVRRGRLAMSASLLGGRSAGRTLEEIHLHGIGNAIGGVTAAEITARLVGALTSSVLTSVADLGAGAVNDGLHAAKGAGGSVFNKAKSLIHK